MGDYDRAFITSGALCLMTAAMVLQIGRGREPEEVIDAGETQVEPAIG
jgi:hypothetical protein